MGGMPIKVSMICKSQGIKSRGRIFFLGGDVGTAFNLGGQKTPNTYILLFLYKVLYYNIT